MVDTEIKFLHFSNLLTIAILCFEQNIKNLQIMMPSLTNDYFALYKFCEKKP